MLCWVDIETTGLKAAYDVPLEVGLILTDDNLNEIARFEKLIAQPDMNLEYVDEVVIEMHEKSGLWKDWKEGPKASVGAFTTLAADFLDANGWDEENKPYLAGATVNFDREFLSYHFPYFHEMLHYRNVDVTTVKRLAEMWLPELRESQQIEAPERKIHRVIPDLEDSIAQLKFYKEYLFLA